MKRRERISLLARPAAEAAGGSAAPKKLYQEPVGTLRARDRVTKMAATKLNDTRLRGEGSSGVDLKSTIVLNGLALLLVDVLIDHVICDGARRDRKTPCAHGVGPSTAF
jgi:hypothetical protein